MRKYLLLFLGCSIHLCIAQNAVSSRQYSELSAFESFQARKYQSVIGDLQPKGNRTKDEQILLLLSELKTGNDSPEEVEAWLRQNPKHPIKPLVSYHLGEYFFYKKDTLKSKRYLSSITPTDLTKQDQASYGYIYGLLNLDAEKYKNAKNLFQFARKSGFEETNKLAYYEGFADYHLGNLDAAYQNFQKSTNADEFTNSSRFFMAKILLEKGQTDEVIQMSQNELSDDKTVTNSGFHQLIGEAYASKNEVAKADAFFERAIELHPGKPSAALYYQAGVSKFKIGNEQLAIQFLTESGIRGGEYAQLSAFQLGRLYLKKKEYENALSAYIEASASSDDVILEESLFQAASINAQLGHYAQAINYADDYLKQYKSSERYASMQNLIAQCYLRTSNYDLAIEHLNNVGVSSNTQKEVYQKVTYQKAILSFNDADFTAADRWLKESLKFTPDQSLKNNANYHLAEISMRTNRYDEAIRRYKSQTTLDANSNYGLGYAYYNKQQYELAIPYFRSARNASESSIKEDANVRLADCLYATKSYQEALNVYNQLGARLGSAYLTYQKGMTLKNLDRKEEAISTFRQLMSNDRYGAQARFQSGMIQFESANFSQAETYFGEVVNSFPNSTYLVESLLNRGISRKNLGELEAARSDYETILEEHIQSDIALNAILGLQELQQAGLNVQKLDKYIGAYKQANPESGSLELIEFEAAKRLYFDFSYAKAAEAFQKFLKDYPSSSSKTEAKYYQADSYYRIDELSKALPLFDELKYVRNPLTGRILSRLGEINKRLNKPSASEEAYKLLVDLNLSAKDTYNARQGLMQLYFDQQRYAEAINVSNSILNAEWKPLNAEQEAMLIKAQSNLQLGNQELAQADFKLLSNNKDVYGAQSNYYLGLIAFQNGNYDQSLDLLFDLNTNYGSYVSWVDRSYLLIAKNYIKKEELFQAKATLRSIIQHSQNEGIKKESQRILIEIEQTATQGDTTQIKD